jgi:hypothetical protein
VFVRVVERTPCPATAEARKPRPWPQLSSCPQKPVPRNKNIHVREKRGRKKTLTGENCARCDAVETKRSASSSKSRLQPPALSPSAPPLSQLGQPPPLQPGEVARLLRAGDFFPEGGGRGLFPGRGRGEKAGNR